MTDSTYPSHLHPEPGRLQFWLDRHPGQRPPDHLLPNYLKATYAEWDEADDAPILVELPQRMLFEAVV